MLLLAAFSVWTFCLSIIRYRKLNSGFVFLGPLLVSLLIPFLLATEHPKLADLATLVFFVVLTTSVVFKIFYNNEKA